MALFTESNLRRFATQYRTDQMFKSADSILREAASTSATSFDVFLSHSFNDAELILGIARALNQHGLRVYVDWIVDAQMDRSRVTPATAERLRQRMRQSASLVYAHSVQSGASKWMPWELGYFDGFRSAVAILPVVQADEQSFVGQEYLGLYPYVDVTAGTLWVNRGAAPNRLFQGEAAFKSFVTWLAEQRTS